MNHREATMALEVSFAFKGKAHQFQVEDVHKATGRSLYDVARSAFDLDNQTMEVKLLLKGKRIDDSDDSIPLSKFATVDQNKKIKVPKIMVMATQVTTIDELSTKRSDPTIRGFDQEMDHSKKRQQQKGQTTHWADGMTQHKEYKFCRLEPCHDQSFGHRATDKTPHAFAARQLLEKLSTDPGIVAICIERELVVGTLGEMDPIDDRIMLAKQQETNDQSRLLGYNTNAGSRIDLKLRTDDLSGFRPYEELVSTLIHELSHNWVGDHNLLFWTNFAQMRAEYFFTHARLMRSSLLVNGKTTAELAGLDRTKLQNVYQCIMSELVRDMAQHHLHPNMIEAPIRQRIRELEEEDSRNSYQGQRLGGTSAGDNHTTTSSSSTNGGTARERALAAAERRAKEQRDANAKDGNS